jgi:hypothetical protein
VFVTDRPGGGARFRVEFPDTDTAPDADSLTVTAT